MNIKNIIRLHNLILMETTGSPEKLAIKFEVSQRTIYNYIFFMKTELNAIIKYDSIKESYCYDNECKLCFKA